MPEDEEPHLGQQWSETTAVGTSTSSDSSSGDSSSGDSSESSSSGGGGPHAACTDGCAVEFMCGTQWKSAEACSDWCEANLDDTSSWLRKAIGWALRDYARTDPDWVWEQVDRLGDRLSGLSRREATKHRS